MRGKGIFALAAAAALAAPASAATSDVHIANFAFAPSTTRIQPGDTVTWHWDGPDLNHSVTSDPGQSASFDSDPGNSSPLHVVGDTFSHTFGSAGTFTYHCKVHSFMHGKVVVGTPPPPTGGTAAPAISSLRASGGRFCRRGARACRAKSTRISFKLSASATLNGKVVSLATGKRVLGLKASGNTGANRITFSPRQLKSGSYKITLTATDSAGHRSPAASARFRVR
jgi:plastocyanin